MERRFNSHLSTLLLLLGMLLANNSYANEKIVLQLKWKHQFQFAGFYAAQAQGFYAEEGLDVEIREVDPLKSSVDSVLSGDAQFGISDSSLVLARLKGQPLVIMAAIFQHSPLVLLTLESSNIISPLELKNKRVMYRKNVDDAVLFAMFAELGIENKDYQHIKHTFNDAELINGTIDAMSAYITNQPYFFQQQNIPVNIISPINYGIDFYGDMLFVKESYLRNNEQQALAFRRASLKGWNYALKHQEAVVDWILNNTNTTKSKAHLLYEAEKTARLIQPELIEIGYFNSNRLSRIANLYKEIGLAPINAGIQGIDYKDHTKHKSFLNQWAYPLLLISLLLIAILFIFWSWNRQLKIQVALKTDEINRYFEVINKYVIAYRTTAEGLIFEVSEALCQVSGYTPEDLIGRPFNSFYLKDIDQESEAAVYKTIRETGIWTGEFACINKAGNIFWLHLTVEPEYNINNTIKGFACIASDITDKKKIETLSMTDSLTNLANRRHLDQNLVMQIAQAKRYKQALSIVLFDIDHFKQVNDIHGHNIGDNVITIMANLIKNHTRQSDMAGRWGGEEFMLVCPNTRLNNACHLAELLRLLVANHTFPTHTKQTCSFGVAEWDGKETLAELINRADIALYKAKSSGRNRVEPGLST